MQFDRQQIGILHSACVTVIVRNIIFCSVFVFLPNSAIVDETIETKSHIPDYCYNVMVIARMSRELGLEKKKKKINTLTAAAILGQTGLPLCTKSLRCGRQL